jgi:carbonic anhydrase/acetyltransferase-like protein (isoleucine patch superfamily)
MAKFTKYKEISPTIGEGVFMVDCVNVIGDVKIGADSSLWFGVVVRGDVNYIRIGERTNVQDNSVLHVTKETHPLIIGSEVTIGHGVILHGCTIKDRCLIGMGAIVLDGAVIGEDSIVGAGALVTENKEFPQGSLIIGSPAKVVRELTDAEIKRIKQSSVNYMGYSNNYRDEEAKG